MIVPLQRRGTWQMFTSNIALLWKAEGRKQKAESRKQKAKTREYKSEGRGQRCPALFGH